MRGKTGTAENPHGDPHSWFTGYITMNNKKKMSIVVLIDVGPCPCYRLYVDTIATKNASEVERNLSYSASNRKVEKAVFKKGE